MTTKRFRSGLAKNDEFSDEIIDELTGKHYFDSTKDDYVFSEEIVDLLNKIWEQTQRFEKHNKDLTEENGQLRTKNNAYIQDIEVFKEENTHLKLENEQLKTTIQQLRTDNTKQKKLLNTTMKENEHIKQTIKDMINTERTEIGKMTLRQLWRQIQ